MTLVKKQPSQKLMILIWNMGIGGIQKRVKDIIIDLQTNRKYANVEVILVVKYEEPSFFTQELLKKTKSNKVKIIYYTPSHQKSKRFPSIFWVIKQYLKHKPDVLLTFLDHLSVTAVFIKYVIFWHKCKVVLNEGVLTSRYLQLNRGRWVGFFSFLVKTFYRYADRIVVPSLAVKNDLINSFQIPSDIIHVIPNWTLFTPPKKTVSKKYDLAYVGRYEEEKNPMLFLEVVRRVSKEDSKVTACMVGSGKLEEKIMSYIKKHKLSNKVSLLSPQNNMQQVLPQCRLLVVTSKNEGLPNVVLEAGALSIPSISTPFLGVEEVIIDGKTGWIIESSQEIAQLATDLLKNKSKITKTGILAQKHINQHFSIRNQRKFISTVLNA